MAKVRFINKSQLYEFCDASQIPSDISGIDSEDEGEDEGGSSSGKEKGEDC